MADGGVVAGSADRAEVEATGPRALLTGLRGVSVRQEIEVTARRPDVRSVAGVDDATAAIGLQIVRLITLAIDAATQTARVPALTHRRTMAARLATGRIKSSDLRKVC